MTIEPVEGQAVMAKLRAKQPIGQWTNGPAKLTKALEINKSQNGASLFAPDGVIWIEAAAKVAATDICRGPRVGLGKTPEPWFSIPWRFWEKGNRYVSKYR